MGWGREIGRGRGGDDIRGKRLRRDPTRFTPEAEWRPTKLSSRRGYSKQLAAAKGRHGRRRWSSTWLPRKTGPRHSPADLRNAAQPRPREEKTSARARCASFNDKDFKWSVIEASLDPDREDHWRAAPATLFSNCHNALEHRPHLELTDEGEIITKCMSGSTWWRNRRRGGQEPTSSKHIRIARHL